MSQRPGIAYFPPPSTICMPPPTVTCAVGPTSEILFSCMTIAIPGFNEPSETSTTVTFFTMTDSQNRIPDGIAKARHIRRAAHSAFIERSTFLAGKGLGVLESRQRSGKRKTRRVSGIDPRSTAERLSSDSCRNPHRTSRRSGNSEPGCYFPRAAKKALRADSTW